MLNTKAFIFLSSLLSLLFLNPGYGQSFTSVDQFKTYIEKFALQAINKNHDQNLHVQVTALDPQMNLPVCEKTIERTLAQPLSKPVNTIILTCSTPQKWVLYIPIQVSMMTSMLVASRKINPTELINHDNVTLELRDKNQTQDDYFTAIQNVEGHVANRMIPAGSILTKNQIKPIPLVRKNQPITLILKYGALQISMSGLAKTDGFLHDTIKILNPSSKKWVDGIVTGSNRAEITEQME